MSNERSHLQQQIPSATSAVVGPGNYNFGSEDDVTAAAAAATSSSVPISGRSLEDGTDNALNNDSIIDVDDEEDDAIDIKALQEVARRLDIPISALLKQLRSQQAQQEGDDDDEDDDEDDEDNDDDDDQSSISSGDGIRQLQQAAGYSGLSVQHSQREHSSSGGQLTPTLSRNNNNGNSPVTSTGLGSGGSGRNHNSGSGSHNTTPNTTPDEDGGKRNAIYIPSIGGSGRQIRIKGAVSDIEEAEALHNNNRAAAAAMTSPATRGNGVRFPSATAANGGGVGYGRSQVRPINDDASSVGASTAPLLREVGGNDNDDDDMNGCSSVGRQSFGAESMKTAGVISPSSASSSNPCLYSNAHQPTKSALNKKSSMASNGSGTNGPRQRIDSRMSGGSAGKSSAKRFGRAGGKEKMLKSSNSEGNLLAAGGSNKKAVRFGELQQVHVFEVDNSLYISIEYSRPLIGWVLLFVGVFLRVFMNTIDSYKLAHDPDAAYGFSTGRAIGRAVICLLIALPVWYFFMKPTKREARFLKSFSGISLVVATGIIYTLSTVAQQSASRITDQWRPMATYSLHPAIIVLYGKVFRNSVFVEELIGVAILAVGFSLAMVPTDIRVDDWYFAEIITFAQSIYVSSFLFMAVKARGNQVSVPVTMASVSFFSLIIQFIVCAIAGLPFDNSTTHSVFEFTRSDYLGFFFATTLCDVLSLACCLLALRFIPPLTVSTSWVIEPLLTQLVVSFLFFNENFRVWNMCTEDQMKNNGLRIFCGIDAFSYWYASGALVAVLATGYIIYVSTIKRSKVELLIKKLKKRKTPKNPYKSRSSEDVTRGGKYRSSSGGGSANSSNASHSGPTSPNTPQQYGSYGTVGMNPQQQQPNHHHYNNNSMNNNYQQQQQFQQQHYQQHQHRSRSRDNVYPAGQIYGSPPQRASSQVRSPPPQQQQ